MIKEHELIQIATGNFRIDFIKAYALDCNEEIIGEGSAYVLMENGEIELTCIFNEFNKYILFERMNVAEKEVFPKDCYITGKLVDLSGAAWVTDRFIPHSLNLLPSSQIIKNKIADLTQIDNMKTGICGYKYFFKKSYKIPVGNYSYYPDKMVLDKSKVIFESIEIEFKHNKEYTTIEILSNKRVSESRAENIIRAVSLMTGQVFTPFCKMTFNDDCVTSKIYKKYPFKQIHNMFSYIFMNESISNYIAKSIASGVDLHDFLFILDRSIIARKAHFDMFCLSICTGIEMLCKKYFYKFGLKEELNISDDTKKLLDEINRQNKKLHSIINSSLGNYKNFNTLTALRNLYKEKALKNEHVEAWRSLRNQLSHANPDGKIQDKINKAFTCLELFYLLNFIVIGYEGNYRGFDSEIDNKKLFTIPEKIKELDFSQFRIKE